MGHVTNRRSTSPTDGARHQQTEHITNRWAATDRTLYLDKPEGGGRTASTIIIRREDYLGKKRRSLEGEKACDTDVTYPTRSPGSPSKGDLS